jgi:hypothetical protein
MTSPCDEFLKLLEQERAAARKADLDTLLKLQEAKQEVARRIKPGDISQSRLLELADKARSNIWLLRHLVQCLQGAVCANNQTTYTASGERSSPPSSFSRGNV